AHPIDLGFLGCSAFRCENPRFWRLEKLGFPWIPSSEMRLFKRLRGIFGEKKIARALWPEVAAPKRAPAVETMCKRRIVHRESLP
ncbi:MAG: hypothetical protein WAN05_12910, partial [Roseiarcus sp.]